MIVVLYDESDALKFLDLNISCKKIIPLTPNSYSIIKKSKLYENILAPIFFNNDEIHKKILTAIEVFLKNLSKDIKINNIFTPYYNNALIELLLPIISISTYLTHYIDDKAGSFIIIVSIVLQPALSVIVHVYVPADKLAAVSVVCPSLHE